MKSDVDVDQVVLAYLRKKGYTQAEAALKAEAKDTLGGGGVTLEQLAWKTKLDSDSSLANFIMLYNHEEQARSKYDETYSKFRDWMHGSLDLYKPELLAVLFPVFVHSYLDLIQKNFVDEARRFFEKHRKDHEQVHSNELVKLATVQTSQHLAESEIVRTYRNNKYNVRISRYACELLLAFLQDSKFMLILSMINQYVNLKVYPGRPDDRAVEEHGAVTGASDRENANARRKEVHSGLLEHFPPTLMDKEDEKTKKPKEKEGASKKKKQTADDFARIKSRIPLPKLSEMSEQDFLEDLRARVALSSSALPSICFYTFYNTHQQLNTLAFSRDGSLVAAGFADSTIKLWDMEPESRVYTAQPREPRPAKRERYSHLIGHSGPVFGACFSPDRNFLLSCSDDSTVRLWSMEMRSPLVVYRGHNYPVWDVQFSPLGYYFVSASHDRTARVWSTDHAFPLRILAGHLSDVECAKFHPNCNYIATGSTDKTIRLWEVHSGECVRIFTGHHSAVNSVAFSPDGKVLASGGDDKNVILWDIGSGSRIKTLTGHTKAVWSVDFSAEGSLLASGSGDETVRLWDANRARGLSLAEEDEDSVNTALQANVSADVPLAGSLLKRKPRDQGDNLAVYPTLHTPVFTLGFTNRNLLLAAGPARPPAK